ncbi:hypothetical protein F5ESL0236_07765 [Lactobacillus sp. ESL0236]|uniref:hypothetical protein n=1 Tax=unclassified Lactobacillus TaxID=2620435 RepID=UPI000EFAE39C|nr:MULTISPECIES: hypothetical protein [unclassified Lactobacillus]RMC38121.1 hypothetical protein F5ESL0237_07740 [Lactobacillus sp. ESL0237]RMC42668.1 hypothetical protein F5ESL0234_07715 [Lactobacillus sp. ESL0234]RMC43349.1 hypothetical protein F5ESL0236_07765 [Lactobacillus sp. ESL0236]
MSKIKFVNVPRSYRKMLIGTRVLKTSRAIDVSTADAMVKKLASKLKDNEEVSLGIEVDTEDSNKENVFTISDAHIEKSDQNLGLRSIADRLCNDNKGESNEQEALRLANLLEKDLHDDQEAFETSMDYLFNTEKEKNSDKDENIKDDQRPVRGVTPTKVTKINGKSEETTAPITKKEEVNKKSENKAKIKEEVAPNPNDFLPHIQHQTIDDESKIKPASEEEIIARSTFIAEKNIFQAVSDKNSEQVFNLTEIKRRLGYIDNPQDCYQRTLNAEIERDLEKCHLKNAAEEYKSAAARLKNDAISDLEKNYSEVNQSLIEDTVAGQVKNEIFETTGAASQEKKTNQVEAQQKIEAKNKELDDEKARRLADFTNQLDEEMRHRKEAFEKEQQLLVEKRNNQVEQDTKLKEKELKEKYRLREIQKRNSKLRSMHQETENRYNEKLENLFQEHKTKFAKNLEHLEKSVQTQSSRIDRQKKKDEKTKQMLEQQQAKISVIKRANQLKEQELKYLEQHDKEYPIHLTETLSVGVANAIKEALKEQQQAIVAGKTIDLDKAVDRNIKANNLLPIPVDSTKDLEKTEEQGESKATHKSKHIYSLAAILLLGLLGAAGYGSYYWYNAAHPDSKIDQTAQEKLLDKNKGNKSEAAQTKNKQVVNQPSKNKAEKAYKSNVLLYRATNNWSAKIDVLDGALGQGDVRALKEINDAYPTWISRLYYAVAANDENGMRSIYLQLTPRQKEKVSYVARHAIALSFYNVKDWHNGWLAKNGY